MMSVTLIATLLRTLVRADSGHLPIPARGLLPQAGRLVSLSESNSSRGWDTAPVSEPTFEDWSARIKAVRPIAAVRASAVPDLMR